MRQGLGRVQVLGLRDLDRQPAWGLADAGGSIWKASSMTMTAMAALLYGPVSIAAWVTATIAWPLGVVVAVAGVVPAYAALTSHSIRIASSGDAGIRDALREAGRAAGSVLRVSAWWLLVLVVTSGVGILALPRAVAAMPAAVAERAAPVRRGGALTRGVWVRTIAAIALAALPGLVLAGSLTALLGGVARFVDSPVTSSFAGPAVALMTTVGAVLVLPWVAATGVAVYLAGRQRSEDLDLWIEIVDLRRMREPA